MRVPYEWWKKSAVRNNRVGHHESTLNQLDGEGTRQLSKLDDLRVEFAAWESVPLGADFPEATPAVLA